MAREMDDVAYSCERLSRDGALGGLLPSEFVCCGWGCSHSNDVPIRVPSVMSISMLWSMAEASLASPILSPRVVLGLGWCCVEQDTTAVLNVYGRCIACLSARVVIEYLDGFNVLDAPFAHVNLVASWMGARITIMSRVS